MTKLGIITYDHPHLKTEQVLLRWAVEDNPLLDDCAVYCLPFMPRKERPNVFAHRPAQDAAAHPAAVAKRLRIPCKAVENDAAIGNGCKIYLILGAGILSPGFVEGKKIINCHPGIIPAVRGLDAFKWAVYRLQPLGITLHYVDKEVDAGETIAILRTPVFSNDSLATLARRHYEMEIDVLANFEKFLAAPQKVLCPAGETAPNKRMPSEKDAALADKAAEYIRVFGKTI